MAQRRVEICQEDASGVMVPVAITPTAAKTTLSFGASGTLVINTSAGAITDATAASADPVPKADYDALVTKFNAALAALRTANIIN